jgi:hypothetical protein
MDTPFLSTYFVCLTTCSIFQHKASVFVYIYLNTLEKIISIQHEFELLSANYKWHFP